MLSLEVSYPLFVHKLINPLDPPLMGERIKRFGGHPQTPGRKNPAPLSLGFIAMYSGRGAAVI
jgi:hypothetical protein